MDSQNLLPRTLVSEQWAKNHAKDERIAGRYLKSKSVVPLGQSGMETKAASDANCPDEHFHHGQYCPFESPVVKLAPSFLSESKSEKSLSVTQQIFTC